MTKTTKTKRRRRPQQVAGDRRNCLETFKGGDGQWYWRLWSRTGKIVADGSEAYTRPIDGDRAADRVVQMLRGEFVRLTSRGKCYGVAAAAVKKPA